MLKVALPPAGQRVGLVDQQHATDRRVEHLLHLQRRLPHEAGDQPGPVRLDQVSPLDHAEGPVDLGQQAGHGRLARAGVAGEDEVPARLGHRQATFLTQLRDPDEVGDELDLGLDPGEPDEPVQLGVQLLQGPRRRQLGRRLRRRRGLRRRAGPWRRRRPWHGRRAPERLQQHRPEALELLQLEVAHEHVRGGDLVGQGHGPLVVGPRRPRPVPPVAGQQHLEEGRGPLHPRPAAGHQAGPPHVRRRGPGQAGVEQGTEGAQQREQLVVGVQPVGVDEGGHDVEGLEGHVARELVGPQGGHPGAERLDRRGQLVHEALDLAAQRLRHDCTTLRVAPP